MSIFRTTHIYNSDKIEKYHPSKEEAVTFLTIKAFEDFLGRIPTKGMNLEKRADTARQLLPALLDRLEEIEKHVEEYKPVK